MSMRTCTLKCVLELASDVSADMYTLFRHVQLSVVLLCVQQSGTCGHVPVPALRILQLLISLF